MENWAGSVGENGLLLVACLAKCFQLSVVALCNCSERVFILCDLHTATLLQDRRMLTSQLGINSLHEWTRHLLCALCVVISDSPFDGHSYPLLWFAPLSPKIRILVISCQSIYDLASHLLTLLN